MYNNVSKNIRKNIYDADKILLQFDFHCSKIPYHTWTMTSKHWRHKSWRHLS